MSAYLHSRSEYFGCALARAQNILGALSLTPIPELLSAARAQTKWAALTKALLLAEVLRLVNVID